MSEANTAGTAPSEEGEGRGPIDQLEESNGNLAHVRACARAREVAEEWIRGRADARQPIIAEALRDGFMSGAAWAEERCGAIHYEEQLLWRARWQEVGEIVTDAAALFRSYEVHHRANADRIPTLHGVKVSSVEFADATEKANRNAVMAERLEAWLVGERAPAPCAHPSTREAGLGDADGTNVTFCLDCGRHLAINGVPIFSWEGPCPVCRGQTFAQVDEAIPSGGFNPGSKVRCVNCKTVVDLAIYDPDAATGCGVDALPVEDSVDGLFPGDPGYHSPDPLIDEATAARLNRLDVSWREPESGAEGEAGLDPGEGPDAATVGNGGGEFSEVVASLVRNAQTYGYEDCADERAQESAQRIHAYYRQHPVVLGDLTFPAAPMGEPLPCPAEDPVGRRVSKRGGDYEFDGEIRAVIPKRSGEVRYAVEDDRGLLLIMNRRQCGLDAPRTYTADGDAHPFGDVACRLPADERWRIHFREEGRQARRDGKGIEDCPAFPTIPGGRELFGVVSHGEEWIAGWQEEDGGSGPRSKDTFTEWHFSEAPEGTPIPLGGDLREPTFNDDRTIEDCRARFNSTFATFTDLPETPYRVEGVADLTALRLQTVDPVFDPAKPVTVNGYAFIPKPDWPTLRLAITSELFRLEPSGLAESEQRDQAVRDQADAIMALLGMGDS